MTVKPGYQNLISLSIAPVNITVGKLYSDLMVSIELMKDIQREYNLDGFEFQCLEEWDENRPPVDSRKARLDIWRGSRKYSIERIADLLKDAKLNILSVHAKRDIGIYLCSDNSSDIEKGKRLIHEALWFTGEIGSSVCVFHLWDTRKQDFDIEFLRKILTEISLEYPGVIASVENVPTNLKGCTPYDLVKEFQWITLDLQWAALYNELEKFVEIKDRIVNIHLRGELENSRWVVRNSTFEFYETLNMIRESWNYKGILTMEPNGLKVGEFDELMSAMGTLKKHIE